MREIKFRAWDGKRMLTGECLYWNGISFVSGVWNFEEEYIPTENQVAVEVMQFTGLTDVNGVEIYEGDIVQMYRHCDDLGSHKKAQRMIYRSEGSHSVYTGMINNIMKVSYLFGSICLNAADGSSGLTRNFSSLARPGESMEVIGNTHQNPELLEQ